MHASSRRGSRWLPWIVGLLALVALLVLSVVFRAQEHRSRAWSITRSVAQRLATDEGARDLYSKNPGLSESYASVEAFQHTVQTGRGALGTLPDREPGEDRNSYEVHTDPEGFRVFVKGSGGGWMMLAVEQSDGSEAGHAAIGEGITALGFGDSVASLHDLQRSTREIGIETQWQAFLAVEQALLTDEGTRSLLQANPELAPNESARAAFLQQAQAWRPRLTAATPPATLATAPEGSTHFYRHTGPLIGEREKIAWKVQDGAFLQMSWNNHRLVKVALGN